MIFGIQTAAARLQPLHARQARRAPVSGIVFRIDSVRTDSRLFIEKPSAAHMVLALGTVLEAYMVSVGRTQQSRQRRSMQSIAS